MVWLKFYTEERIKYAEAHNIHSCDEQAQKIAKKLLRRFAPRAKNVQKYFSVRFYGSNGAMAYLSSASIRLPHNPTFLEICHEVAHIVSYVKTRNSRHDKKLMRLIGRMTAYCKKKGYWISELANQKEA